MVKRKDKVEFVVDGISASDLFYASVISRFQDYGLYISTENPHHFCKVFFMAMRDVIALIPEKRYMNVGDFANIQNFNKNTIKIVFNKKIEKKLLGLNVATNTNLELLAAMFGVDGKTVEEKEGN